MTDIVCPLCGTHNPPDQEECLNCQAPLKASGFLTPPGEAGVGGPLIPSSEKPSNEEQPSASSLEQSVPDWLKETEASFLEPLEPEADKPASDQVSEQIESLLNESASASQEREPAIDDAWLASLLEGAGLEGSPAATSSEQDAGAQNEASEFEETEAEAEEPIAEQYTSPDIFEKPSWVSDLESGSTSKLEEEPLFPEPEEESLSAGEVAEIMGLEENELPRWVGKVLPEEDKADTTQVEPALAPAELPPWLEALRPKEEEELTLSPSGPVEDLSAADVVTAGPLSGLRGVISPQSSAIRARKPPTYSIKLRVTEEQRARVEMMEELLANEQQTKPLPPKPIITSQHVSRLIVAVVLILPIVWTIITGSQRNPTPKPANLPGVMNFSQQVHSLPTGSPVLVAFDYEAGFSGEMNLAIRTIFSQLMLKNAYLTLVATNPSGPALAEGVLDEASLNVQGLAGSYANYTNLGYIPGGTLGLLGLAISPRTLLPYSLDGSNVWATAPLNSVSSIADFTAVILITNDPATARSWIEQVGPQLQEKNTPLLMVTSAQAEPLILPYSQSIPSQVQGLVAGLAGGLAYSSTLGTTQPAGLWDALSSATTVSVLIILVGAIIGMVIKLFPPEKA